MGHILKRGSNLMNKKFRVSFNSPQSGFMSVGLRERDQEFVTAVAHEPYDSLRDLIVALTAALAGDSERTVKWNCEPDELDLRLKAEGDAVSLGVVHYLSHRRSQRTSQQVFATTGPKLEVCGAFWKALRELHRDIEVDEFSSNWRREFPEAEMQGFTKAFRES
ncbi:MAG: hypothetical protein ACRD9R_20020, partial [Pyrinomonadaceae bacterium]